VITATERAKIENARGNASVGITPNNFGNFGNLGNFGNATAKPPLMRRVAAQLLSSYLLVWAPGMFAIELLSALPSMGMRGPLAWIELAAHAVVATVCAIAGWMIRVGAPAASTLAAAGIIARAAVAIQSLFWTLLPGDVAPGARGAFTALACANAALWLGVVAWTRTGE
jgi:hypothetical protein